MKQRSQVNYYAVICYDDTRLTEREAQEVALQEFPETIGAGHKVTIETVQQVRGLVDDDGVPVQPKASAA